MTTYVSGAQVAHGSNAAYSDANWRLWVGYIRAALNGVGLVQTSDTGLNGGLNRLIPESTTAPTTNTLVGYEIWRFSDAAQATDPVFLKLFYGKSGTSSAWYFGLQVGQGSDGAGSLTGVVSTYMSSISYDSYNSSPGSAQTYAYFGNGNFWIADLVGATSPSNPRSARVYFNVSRTRNDAGALDGRGVVILMPNTGTQSGDNKLQFVRWAAGNTKVYAQSMYHTLGVGTRASPDLNSFGEKNAWPVMYFDGAAVKKLWSCFAAARGTIPTSPTYFTAAPYGTTRTWVSWNTAPPVTAYISGAYETYDPLGLVMLWE